MHLAKGTYMRYIIMGLIIGLLFMVYGLLNYYIGLRIWQLLVSHIFFFSNRIYWVVFWFIATSYFIGMFGNNYLPTYIVHPIKIIGSYWLAAMYYFFLVLIVYDVMRLLWNRLNLSNSWINTIPPIMGGVLILFVVFGIIFYGTWNAHNPRLVTYDIVIPKEGGRNNTIHAVLVSDIHLGPIVDNRRLGKMVDTINGLTPDIIMLAGDIIDNDVEVFTERQMVETFKKLNSRLGTFGVLGNHEYIGGNAEQAMYYLEMAGIIMLRDSYLEVDEGLYIVGRDDRSGARFTGENRKDLSSLLEGIDNTKTIILMDHQPFNLEEVSKAGVDLQVSGHTHRGQLFPNHLITQKLFENDWGYLKKDNLHVIVSSGFGTWGPPIRVGNKPEIVSIRITFKPK